MGFVGTHNIILHDDVIINSKMTYLEKIKDMSSYKESPGVEIIKPSIEVCNKFKNRIFQARPAINIYRVENSRLEEYSSLPNKYNYSSIDDVFKHLEDNSKIYFFAKLVSYDYGKSKIFSLYVYEKSNISNMREEKINLILNENNTM